jgi:hypothetical protein
VKLDCPFRYGLGLSSDSDVRSEEEAEVADVRVRIKRKAVSDLRMTTPKRRSAKQYDTTECLPRTGTKMPLGGIVKDSAPAAVAASFGVEISQLPM